MVKETIGLEFINWELYATYSAISRLLGQRAWEVVWLSGEILFDELEKELNITEREPLAVLSKIGRWFEQMGYVEQTRFNMPSKETIEYWLHNAIIIPCAERLMAEGSAPPHFSTALMFAGLKKKCGLRAEMAGEPIIFPDGWAKEEWKLYPLAEG